MNILDFDKWISAIKEGFKADINSDKSEKDEIEIESPNEGSNITYIIDDKGVKTKKNSNNSKWRYRRGK